MTAPSPAPLGTDAETPEPRRRFLLARLAMAVRRQDWFTVLVEITIVVLGVVIGFQVTGWGQARADRVQEQAYLRQLAADLRQTQREAARVDSFTFPADRAGAALFHTYVQVETPPDDSLASWFVAAYDWDVLRPVTGTAEALVATGDLGLIRNDSLRTAVTTYIERSRVLTRTQEDWVAMFFEAAESVWSRVGSHVMLGSLSDAAVDSLAQARPFWYFPTGPRRPAPPLRPRALLAAPETRAGLDLMVGSKGALRLIREEVQEHTTDLLVRVEAEIEP